ncbi:MAG: hypothetical protein OEV89_01475 [Desulfobulbaceae bacterium]|nr:hypothetical protein [Desulfobulbaceae bacterium]HIJ89515.1 hypothetical protein [Deltaproteobacteria bacterium]
MRCPKCGYISFDRQRSCGKCSNDLTAVAEQLKGTVSKAAAPFFLGAILGKQKQAEAASGPALYEEEETLALDELESETPPADEEEFDLAGAPLDQEELDLAGAPLDQEELDLAGAPLDEEALDFAGAPLDADDLEEQSLPSLGLENIDVSDLIPPRDEAEEPMLSLGEEQEEMLPAQAQDEEDSLMGIEMPSLEHEDLMGLDEKESLVGGGFDHEAPEPSESPEDEEIIDLSSLMSFDETPEKPTGQEEHQDIFELSLEDEPDDLHLDLEDDETAPADVPKKPASTAADIPDLGLTLENDDQ